MAWTSSLRNLYGRAKFFAARKVKGTDEIKRAKLLINPMAGEGKVKQAVRKIQRALAAYAPDIHADIFFTRQKGDAANAAREAVAQGYQLVIVAGGDGAMNEVVQGLAESHLPLGIIPMGTSNVCAQEIGIPRDIEKACAVLGAGNVRRVDLGKAGDRYFLWLAGVGIDALVAKEITPEAKDNLGVFAYFMFAFRHARSIPYFSVSMDLLGKRESFSRAFAVIVGNATTYDGNLKIRSAQAMDDGFLDVVVAQRMPLIAILRQMFWFFIGRRTYYRDVKYLDVKHYRVKSIRVDSFPPVLIHTDGEVIGETPSTFHVVPKALSLIVP